MARIPAPGSVVAYWDGNVLTVASVAAEEKQRLRVVLPGGKEDRILPSRVAFEVEGPGDRVADRVAAARRAFAAAERVRVLAGAVDVALLWELARESGEEADLGALASATFGHGDDLHRAALAVAFLREAIRFQRRGDAWTIRDAAAVAELERQRERETARAEERSRLIDSLRATVAGGPWKPSGSDTERKALRALHELAVADLAASESARDLAGAVLDDAGVAGDRPAERAFRLLRKLNHFASDDENLHAHRLGLRVDFPAAVAAAAAAAVARGWSAQGRDDRRDETVITIDGASTRDIDDGLSLEPMEEGFRLGIHVADPAAFVAPGDPVDVEALGRGTSHYLPDLRVPMLPAVISEDAASLVAGADRPALSFLAEVGPDGQWTRYEIRRSVVRSRARLDYDEADEAIRTGEHPHATLLRSLATLAARLESRRAARGALLLKAAEVDVRVSAEGRISIERLVPESESRRIVSEAMVLAGELAAHFCGERGIPSLYRRQPPPASEVAVPPGRASDPAVIRAVRRSLRRGEVATQPGPHFALGLTAYSQATSPLRRFQDLVVHRQIGAALAGAAPPYRPEEIQTVAATTERAEQAARDAERSADRYWLLRYIQSSGAQEVTAVVVETSPPIVQLEETLLEERVPGLTDVVPGDRVTLNVERVNPRADLLILRPPRRS